MLTEFNISFFLGHGMCVFIRSKDTYENVRKKKMGSHAATHLALQERTGFFPHRGTSELSPGGGIEKELQYRPYRLFFGFWFG